MRTKNKILLDASAILALIQGEPGYLILEDVIAHSICSSVNISEVVSVLTRTGVPQDKIEDIIKNCIPEIIPFSVSEAMLAGTLIDKTKSYGLSLGDRACIATAILHKIPVYTTDQIWKKLDLPNLQVIVVR